MRAASAINMPPSAVTATPAGWADARDGVRECLGNEEAPVREDREPARLAQQWCQRRIAAVARDAVPRDRGDAADRARAARDGRGERRRGDGRKRAPQEPHL